MTTITSSVNHRDTIFLYHDTGSVEVCTHAVEERLRRCFTGISIQRISTREIQSGGLSGRGQALIVGGGSVLEMNQNGFRNKDTTEAIKAFLSDGGHYLGICAGAYLASTLLGANNALTTVALDRSSPYSKVKVQAQTKNDYLEFRNQVPARGFDGAQRAPKVILEHPYEITGLEEQDFASLRERGSNVYWCKGPAFDPQLPEGWQVAARYRIKVSQFHHFISGAKVRMEDTYYQLPATVHNGTFVLTGTHLEFDVPEGLEAQSHLTRMHKSSEKIRDAMFTQLCQKAGIHSIVST